MISVFKIFNYKRGHFESCLTTNLLLIVVKLHLVMIYTLGLWSNGVRSLEATNFWIRATEKKYCWSPCRALLSLGSVL